jgi:hypothetical protein
VAIAQSILFLDDRLHSSVAGSSIAAVLSTADGNMHNVRDANLLTSWKPADSAGANEFIRADLGDTAQLGTAGDTAYCCVAYDPRSIDQTTIILQYDNTDNSSFAGATGAGTFTIPLNHVLPTCQWLSFTVPTPAKRHWRLMQRFADRGGTGRTIRIYSWALFAASGVLNLDTGHRKPGPAAGNYSQDALTGIAATPAGILSTNDFGYPVQQIDFGVPPTSSALWQQVRNGLGIGDVNNRALFVQFEGLRNEAQANFFLARAAGRDVQTARGKLERYAFSLQLETEAFV